MNALSAACGNATNTMHPDSIDPVQRASQGAKIVAQLFGLCVVRSSRATRTQTHKNLSLTIGLASNEYVCYYYSIVRAFVIQFKDNKWCGCSAVGIMLRVCNSEAHHVQREALRSARRKSLMGWVALRWVKHTHTHLIIIHYTHHTNVSYTARYRVLRARVSYRN